MNQLGPLLSVRLSAGYRAKPEVLRNACLEVEQGEIVGLVGESGSGKSTLGLSILRLADYRGAALSGEIRFQDRNLLELSDREMRLVRGREIAFVPQSPLNSLNPALSLRTHMNEAWAAHASGARDRRRADFLSLLESVSLPAENSFLDRRPGQLSVGQAQRFLIAMAILHKPALVIADEPTSALDVVTQAEVLKLFSRLNQGLKMAVLYISHDLLSVGALCHRVAILYEGQIVEFRPAEDIFRDPQHPYTRRLIEAMPKTPVCV